MNKQSTLSRQLKIWDAADQGKRKVTIGKRTFALKKVRNKKTGKKEVLYRCISSKHGMPVGRVEL